MALSKLTITNNQWKKISAAGENGMAWLCNTGDGVAKIMIAHTTAAQTPTDDIPVGSAVDLDVTIGYTLPQSGDPNDSVALSADSASDVYYATLIDVGEDAQIIVDFI
jgi:hypothetical protein